VPKLDEGSAFKGTKVSKVHWTVKVRMAAVHHWDGQPYVPKALIQGKPFVAAKGLTEALEQNNGINLIEWVA